LSDEGFISRWSRRKLQAKDAVKNEPPPPPANDVAARSTTEPSAEARPPLPDVESLTPDSDFTQFMEPHVNADTRRAAVKRLFQDPRYNVMDGLDVYIDDYSKPDPLPEGWLEKMTQMSRLGEYREPEPQSEAPVDESAPAPQPDGAGATTASHEGMIEGKAPPSDTPDGGSDAAPLVK
jgi:hypothetical protein